MKVLLVGEYSGVHTNLAKALKSEDIEVVTISDGDSYKNFSSDFVIKYKYIQTRSAILNKFLNIYYLMLDFLGIKGIFQILTKTKILRKLKGYDVVQLINPIALSGYGSIVNILFIFYLKLNNKKIFLCALGDDYFWVKRGMKDNKTMFSLMKLSNIHKFSYSLRYVYGLFFPLLNKLVVKWSNKVIPGLYDYYLCYKDNEKCSEIVPIIIYEDDSITPYKYNGGLINIFHGWQEGKELRKGNIFFDEAVKTLPEDYKKKIHYEVVKSIPYSEYITRFQNSIIFFDQCLSYDRGVNALLGMSEGKVVFSGSENSEFNGCKVVVNSEPDVEFLRKELMALIDNPCLLEDMSKNSLAYIKKNHNPRTIVNQYIRIWSENES